MKNKGAKAAQPESGYTGNVSFDRGGVELRIGDRVVIPATIEAMDRVGVLTLRTDVADEVIGNVVSLKANQVEKALITRAAGDPDTDPNASGKTEPAAGDTKPTTDQNGTGDPSASETVKDPAGAAT